MAERRPLLIRMGDRGHQLVQDLADKHKLSKSEAGRLAMAFGFQHAPALDQFVQQQLAAREAAKKKRQAEAFE